ncbi:MAG: CAP domain-containing protein [Chloroflexota bacterium]|nr:CAP domain-containing protein [Chloroflexota bacterium]
MHDSLDSQTLTYPPQRQPRQGGQRQGKTQPAGTLALLWVLLVALVVGTAQGAAAATPALSVSPSGGQPGSKVQVSGADFPGATSVVLTWDGSRSGMPAVRTGRDGSFRVSLTIPNRASSGQHTLQARAGGMQASTAVEVTSRNVPPATATTAPAQPTAPPSTDSSYRGRLLTLVNEARAREGLSPLRANDALNRAAQSYAETMRDTNCFSHTCQPEPDFVRRAEAAGYKPWRNLGENIAYGYQSADAVFNGWMSSPGHRANILNGAFRDMGTGMASGGTNGPYWAQEFGAQ